MENYCDQLDISFYETSAKEGYYYFHYYLFFDCDLNFFFFFFLFIAINVDKAFEEIARVVLSKTNEEDLKYICFSLCHKMFFVSHNFEKI